MNDFINKDGLIKPPSLFGIWKKNIPNKF
jgi:hypothetical protein